MRGLIRHGFPGRIVRVGKVVAISTTNSAEFQSALFRGLASCVDMHWGESQFKNRLGLARPDLHRAAIDGEETEFAVIFDLSCGFQRFHIRVRDFKIHRSDVFHMRRRLGFWQR